MGKNSAASDQSNPAEEMKSLKARTDRNESLINLLVVVLFIGFALMFMAAGGLIMTYESQRQATYEDLKDQVVQMNTELNQLNQEFQNCNAKRTSGC